MRSGMLLGKFLPPHLGHQFMINFARQCVDELTVVVCSIRSEPLSGALRYAWMRDHFGSVRVVHCDDENPQAPEDDPVNFWKIWKRSLLDHLPGPPDVVFASEPYGVRLAQELGAVFMPVDPLREIMPISGTQIRAEPYRYADWLLPEARPYFVRRVVILGPESSGKSTLTKWLADRFGAPFVPEYGRTFQENVGRDLCLEDMLTIAKAHRAVEDAVAMQARGLIVVDTEAIVTRMWSRVFFGAEPDGLEPLVDPSRYHLYLLAEPHPSEWHDDGWRLQPDIAERTRFFEETRALLESYRCPYHVLSGDWADRQERAEALVRELLSSE